MAQPGETRISIFGGTFDPIHIGHLIIAVELRHRLRLDRVIFVPAGRPPHKLGQQLASQADRLAMVELAIAGTTGLEVCAIEYEQTGLTYTSDTLAHIRQSLPPCRLFFLMGSDSLRDFPRWHEPERIAALAELGVAARPNFDILAGTIEAAVPAAEGRIHLVPVPLIGIASNQIRRRLAAGEPIAYQVPRAVEEYIERHRLYR